MRRLAILVLSIGFLAISAAGSARAATLDFTGTLSVRIFTLPPFSIPGGGSAQVTDDGSFHLLSFLLPGGTFGPISMSLPLTTDPEGRSIRLTLAGNLTGSFGGISGGPPGGGAMGLQGLAKICLIFAPCEYAQVPFPLTPSPGGAGFGIGGTRSVTGGVALTMFHAPWTVGQPVMTIHTPNSTISTPVLPGGFVHGPASLTSSTAQPSGGMQLVTVSKVFTSLVGAFPELPVFSILNLHFFSPNHPPECDDASAGLGELWPPDLKFRDVSVAGVTDPDGDPVAITITSIFQDEPLNGPGHGNTCPDGAGVGTDIASVRAERSGSKQVAGDGRVYHVSFTADDGQGGQCVGEVAVCVPKDRSPDHVCVDQGPLFDSTSCP
jgi:hypothetical protein